MVNTAFAVDADTSQLRFSGFGTLGYIMDDHDQIAPIRDLGQKPDHGFRTGDSWEMDTRIGLQVDYRFSSKLEAVAQLVFRDQTVNSLDTWLQLAYFGINPSANWDVRLGRFGYDVFLMSDHRHLGYAYSWVRPPEEFYSGITHYSMDGIEATYKINTDEGHWRIKGQFGQSKPMLAMGASDYQADMHPIYSLTLTHETGSWRFKTGYSYYKINNEPAVLKGLHDNLLEQVSNLTIGDEAASLLQNSKFSDASKQFMSLGAAYDDGVWLGQAEFGLSQTSNIIYSPIKSAYFVLGRRIGNFTPYVLLSAVRPRAHLVEPINNWGARSGLQQQAVYLVNSTRMDQESVSLGVRWDFHDQAALKLQWTNSHINKNGYSYWYRDIPLYNQDTRINLLSASLDFAF